MGDQEEDEASRRGTAGAGVRAPAVGSTERPTGAHGPPGTTSLLLAAARAPEGP